MSPKVVAACFQDLARRSHELEYADHHSCRPYIECLLMLITPGANNYREVVHSSECQLLEVPLHNNIVIISLLLPGSQLRQRRLDHS